LNFDLAKAVPEIWRLWERGSFLLWAFLAVGAFIGFVTLTFVQPSNPALLLLLVASIIFIIFAVLKRTIKTVRLVPFETQCFYHRAMQTDGKVNTQISIRMNVFNISDKSIWLSDVKLLRPKSHAPVSSKGVTMQDQSSVYHGTYELPPGANTHGSVHLMIQEDLTDQIARGGVKLCIEDQFGHRHKLNLPNLRKS
jgi:hypothetical protein